MGIFGHKPHITETPDVRHITNPDVMHEESDVSISGISTFVVALTVAVLVIAGLMWALISFLNKQAEAADARNPVSPMARTERERIPPPPRLQAARGHSSQDDEKVKFELKEPQLEWIELQKKYNYELQTSGQPDPNTGRMRVPIDYGMQLFLQSNPPARQQQPGQAAGGDEIPSFFSAGRQTERRDQ